MWEYLCMHACMCVLCQNETLTWACERMCVFVCLHVRVSLYACMHVCAGCVCVCGGMCLSMFYKNVNTKIHCKCILSNCYRSYSHQLICNMIIVTIIWIIFKMVCHHSEELLTDFGISSCFVELCTHNVLVTVSGCTHFPTCLWEYGLIFTMQLSQSSFCVYYWLMVCLKCFSFKSHVFTSSRQLRRTFCNYVKSHCHQ